MSPVGMTTRVASRILMLLPSRCRPRKRFILFLMVGGLNTAFGYGAYAACLWLGMHYAVAGAVSTVLGVLFNFKSTGQLVFRSRDNGRLPHFMSVYVITYIVATLCVGGMLHLGIPAWLGGLLLILPCAMLSYLLNSRFVFRP